jgi:catecholate siderophore receptor
MQAKAFGAAVLSATCLGALNAAAQDAPAATERQPAQAPAETQTRSAQTALPPIVVQSGRARPKRQRAARPVTVTRAPSTPPVPRQEPSGDAQSVRAGVAGYVATRSVTATKTDTPLVNVPQSVSVLTREFLQDQNARSIGESVRYVPGVIPHQGESNRDDLIIRGQRSNADFFVDGIRDDVQYYRDFYNVHRIEVLKGPNAMIFGRGGGGGIVNRVLKEADGTRVRELAVQGGTFGDKRAAIDVGQAVNENWAVRFNSVYENSDSYRDFVNLERYGFNPTVTFTPSNDTRVKLSYEYFHDTRVTDRGIPSQFGRPYPTAASTFFGNPDLNRARVDAHILNGVVEHDFGSGLSFRNASRYSTFDKFYQNIFPGGAVNAAGTSVNLTAYNNQSDRQNLFNQSDLTYKFVSGPLRHTLLMGTEVGRQSGLAYRENGFFNNATQTLAVSPRDPVTYVPVTFRNIASVANNTYELNLAAAYLQDHIEVTRYLQLIGGVRFDQFDLTSIDRRTAATINRVDNLVSPRFGVIVKPQDNISIYASYSVSYLPSAGDQFSTLTPGSAIAEPEKFENKEIGAKWELSPRLMVAAAIYDLDRTNQRLADPNNPGFFILSGATKTRGFEASVTGHITPDWQMVGGYAYTDARIVSANSTTIVEGNRVGLVPYNTFSLWNKYQFSPLWAAGVGVIHQTDFYASSTDLVRLPGFTRVDAALFGEVPKNLLPPEIRKVRWQINVENLLNAKYIATADSDNNITPGSPLAVRGTMIASF